jgi:hypothetical protein
MDNPEKLETHGTQDEEKQNKNTICTGYHYAQKNTTNAIRHEPSYKQMEKCGSRNGYHNTELRDNSNKPCQCGNTAKSN